MEAVVIDAITSQIRKTQKYSALNESTVRHIVEKFAKKYRKESEVFDQSKNLLHRIWGSYYSTRPDFKKLVKKLTAGELNITDTARIHTSSLERTKIREELFKDVFAITGQVKTIADFGCGLNPLFTMTLPELKDIERYDAYDIDTEEIAFLNEVFIHDGKKSFRAHVGDLTLEVPRTHYDLALLLKLVPVLEMIEKDCTKRILDSINATLIVISFPSTSLSQKKHNMGDFYEENFGRNLDDWGYSFQIKKYSGEIVFYIEKSGRKVEKSP